MEADLPLVHCAPIEHILWNIAQSHGYALGACFIDQTWGKAHFELEAQNIDPTHAHPPSGVHRFMHDGFSDG